MGVYGLVQNGAGNEFYGLFDFISLFDYFHDYYFFVDFYSHIRYLLTSDPASSVLTLYFSRVFFRDVETTQSIEHIDLVDWSQVFSFFFLFIPLYFIFSPSLCSCLAGKRRGYRMQRRITDLTNSCHFLHPVE